MKLLHPNSKWTLAEWQTCLVHLLKEARENSGLTQEQLAMKLNRDQTFVSKYERGDRELGFFEVLMIGRAVGLDYRDFMRLFEDHCWHQGMRVV